MKTGDGENTEAKILYPISVCCFSSLIEMLRTSPYRIFVSYFFSFYAYKTFLIGIIELFYIFQGSAVLPLEYTFFFPPTVSFN